MSTNDNLNWALGVLGIGLNTTKEELKSKWRELCKQHHPDTHQNNRELAEKRLQDINVAYKIVLKYLKQNPHRKQSTTGTTHNSGARQSKSSTQEDIFNKIQSIIVEKLGIEYSEITMDATYSNYLGADSLDVIEIFMETEKEFNISISEEDEEKITLVGDLVMLVCRAKGIECNWKRPNNSYNKSNEEQYTYSKSKNQDEKTWNDLKECKNRFARALEEYNIALKEFTAINGRLDSNPILESYQESYDSCYKSYNFAKREYQEACKENNLSGMAFWKREMAFWVRQMEFWTKCKTMYLHKNCRAQEEKPNFWNSWFTKEH